MVFDRSAYMKARHAAAREAIATLKSLGIEPKDTGIKYLHQKFLSKKLDLSALPLVKKYNVSFQVNYSPRKTGKKKGHILETAKTYKMTTESSMSNTDIEDAVKEGLNDFYGHKGLQDFYEVQGIEFDRYEVDYEAAGKFGLSDYQIDQNDDVALNFKVMSKFGDTQRVDSTYKYGRKEFDLTNYL